MKRYILIAAAAFLALTSCSKDVTSPSDETGEGTYFTEGQQVTLTCGPQQTKVNGIENASKGIDFTWESGDKIKVTIGTASSEFTLTSGAGTATATFTGQMPASGNTFDVQYPVTDPDLTSQTYIAGALPHDKMKFAATGCSVGSAIALEARYSALGLNLYGWDREVSSITVTNLSDSKIYTLSCDSAVTVGSSSESATPFLLVMPTGTYNFKAEVISEDNDAETGLPDYIDENGIYRGKGVLVVTGGQMQTSSEKTFSASYILNMPSQYLTQIWAPVNCGYVAKTGKSGDALGYPYGKLYQWGRGYGQGYTTVYDATVPTITTYWTGENGAEDSNTFYKYCSSGATYSKDWIKSGDNAYWNTGTESVPTKTKYDPCPTGWRVPTYAELNALIGNSSTSIGGNGWDSTDKGYWFNGSSSPNKGEGLFLPAAGRRGGEKADAITRGEYGMYWSSSVSGDNAWYLRFRSSEAYMSDDNMYRANGFSVRCIKSEESTATAGGFSEVTTW